MNTTATLIKIFPPQTGQGKNGIWKKLELLFETLDSFPKKLIGTAWGDAVDSFSLVEGRRYNIEFDVESREYNGRWYTDVKIRKLESTGEQTENPLPQQPANDIKTDDSGFDPMDILPF